MAAETSSRPRDVAPVLAALTVLVGVPGVGFDFTHLPREVLFALTAAVLAWGLRTRFFTFDRVDGALLGVGTSALLSALAALTFAWAWRPTLLTLGTVLGALALRGREDRQRWLTWQALAVILLAAVGMLEALGVLALAPHGRAPASLLGQRNTLAHLLVLGSPVLWSLSARAKGRTARWAWFLGALLAAFVVIVTRSRAAWLALPLEALIFAASARSPGRFAPLAAVLGAILALLTPVRLVWHSAAPYADTLRRLVDTSSGSGAGRLEQWKQSLSLVPDAPVFGVGPGNWFVAWAPWATSERTNRFVNSDWVGLAVERGAVGVAAVLVAALLVVLAWRRRDDGEAAVVFAVLAGILVTGSLDAVTQLPASAMLLTVVAFTGLAREPAAPRAAPRLALFATLTFALGALACTAALAARWVTVSSHSFDRLELAVRLDPTDALTRLELFEGYVSARRCADAAVHAAALSRDLPGNPSATRARAHFTNFCGPLQP